MKRANVWSEIVYYAECPYCHESNQVGSGGDCWAAGAQHECEKCKKTFELDDQP